MRAPFAIAAVLAGLVLWTAPAMAHDAQRAAGKSIVTAEKDLPTGPRICLFSQNGKRAEPSPDSSEQIEPRDDARPAGDNAEHEAAAPAKIEVANDESRKDAKAEAPAPTRQASERVCDTDVTTPAAPHG
ncbi:MAG: hypothetical protein SGI91_04420 [Alphaproteobacteria bacterium]|jgi:hypothetical protein|nr:hypothetical protein [Alphaproteobacteria bacterium]